MKVLSDRLRDEVFQDIRDGIILHDVDLQDKALKINKELKISHFNASLKWIQRFKAIHRISSRHIMKFVSRRTLQNQDNVEQAALEFVEFVKVSFKILKINNLKHFYRKTSINSRLF